MCCLQCPNLQANKRTMLEPSHNQKTFPKRVSEKEVDRCREIFLKRKKTFDVVDWNKKTFSFQWNRGTALVQNISFCWLFDTQKHWIFSTFISHEKMTNLAIAYPNIVRPRNLCYLTESLQLTQRNMKVAVPNIWKVLLKVNVKALNIKSFLVYFFLLGCWVFLLE